MTERIYYFDSYLRQFEARVIRATETEKGLELVFDRTAFYPASGGQPHDLGTIHGVHVREVVEDEQEEIIHRVDQNVDRQTVNCELDWERRFDHMQQHTGQHILSQAFIQTAKLNTVGFHMGDDTVTIDLDLETLSPKQLDEAEKLANAVVFENRPIKVRVVPPEEVPKLTLRKESRREGVLRVVEVEDFDVSACGGTHVRRTGEIGTIAIRKVERINRQARVEFVCGRRATTAQRQDLEYLSAIARQFSVGLADAPARVQKQLEESRELRRVLQKKNRQLADLLARELFLEAPEPAGFKIVKQHFPEEEIDFLKLLAQSLLAQGQCAVLLGAGSEAANLVLAQSEDLALDLRQILTECCALIEGKGGGSRTLVQAGGRNASRLRQALDLAEERITSK